MSTTKYVRCSLQHLHEQLSDLGHQACPTTIAALLREQDYALHVNRKNYDGPAHPERDLQFEFIQDTMLFFAECDQPIISVDTKKKELVGNFANPGVTWSRAGEEVNSHDFLRDACGRAVPYGIYDYLANRGHVVVGHSADTPAFAVDAIVNWWRQHGLRRYPHATDLLILPDAGGSNGYRPRLWKYALQTRLADVFGLGITVCHYPPGASKWNPIEHRLFGPISTNWAGIPLRSWDILLGLLRGTKTTTGLKVTATLNQRIYQTGMKVSRQQMQNLSLQRHDVCPLWNYFISPRQPELLN